MAIDIIDIHILAQQFNMLIINTTFRWSYYILYVLIWINIGTTMLLFSHLTWRILLLFFKRIFFRVIDKRNVRCPRFSDVHYSRLKITYVLSLEYTNFSFYSEILNRISPVFTFWFEILPRSTLLSIIYLLINSLWIACMNRSNLLLALPRDCLSLFSPPFLPACG